MVVKHAASAIGLAALLAGCATTTPSTDGVPAETATLEVPAPIIPMPSAPLDENAPITRIGFGSCLQQNEDQTIWSAVGAKDPDVFLYIGDNVYGDVRSGDPMMPELRQAYRQLAESEPFAAFRAQTPMMVTWDDHDYGMNDQGGNYPFKYGAEAIFEEAWAVPADDPRRARDGIYYSKIVGAPGQRVQLIMLDTRFFRGDLLETDERDMPGKERYMPDLDPSKTMLGADQYKWLLEELAKPADLRIIASSVQVIADGHGWEAWRQLPAERQRFYDTLSASAAEHIVLVSGDRHAGALYKNMEAVPYTLYEATSSSLNLPGSRWRNESGETRVEDGPFRLGTMEYDVNFGMIDVDWAAETVDLKLHGADGGVLQSVTVSFKEMELRD